MKGWLAACVVVASCLMSGGSVQAQHQGHCGLWQHEYAKLHASILSGSEAPKYLVVNTVAGLADSLTFIGGMLYLAVLSGRAIQLVDNLPFAAAYTSPHIDWRETDKGNLTHNSSFLGTTADMPYDHSDVQIMRNQTLEAVGGGADVLAIAGNLGVMGLLFDNPHYKQRVSLMGLRPDYAYGCAIDFLFAPGPAVLEAFEKEFEVLQSPALKIGIQIRLGDSFLQGNNEPMEHGEATFDFVKQFFECAEGLQGTFGQPGQQVVWFLISDSIQVRQAAVDMYGSDRVMTRLESPGHVANTAGADQQQAMLLAAGEHWLFGMADYHVISARGGFGRNAALRSRKWHSMYRLDQAIPPDSRQICDGIHTKPVDFSSIAMTAPFV